MKKTLLLILLTFPFMTGSLKSQDKAPSLPALNKELGSNFSSISEQRKYDKELVKRFIPEEYWDHPDLGSLPYNAECENCIEQIQKRTEFERSYIDANDPSIWYKEASITPSNYKVNGKWIAINPNLKQVDKTLYAAYNQPFLTEVNIKEGWTSLKVGNQKLLFNRLVLIEYDKNSNITTYQPNWSNHTVGDNGVYVYDIFPDIDMTLQFRKGSIESNFIIKVRKINVEKLIFRDNLDIPLNMTLNREDGIEDDKGWIGEIAINDENGNSQFIYKRIGIKDNSKSKDHGWLGHYSIDSDKIDVLIYADLLDNDTVVYPLIVDPFVTYGPFAAPSFSIGSQFFANCTQTLSVSYPGGSEPQDFSSTWDVYANGCCAPIGDCWLSDAEVFITSGCGGRTPTGAQVWVCSGSCNGPGNWTPTIGYGSDGTSSMISCYPPSCAAQSMTFSFNLKRIYCSDAGCNCNWATNWCIALDSWSVTLRGRTVEQASNLTSSSGTTFCQGTSTTLSASGSYGVPGYSYSWSPAGPVVTPPVGTTVYTVTTTDACGNSAMNSITITALPNSTAPSGITASSNPICPGNSTTLTLFGGSLAAGASWNWYSSGCGSGFITTGSSISVSPGSTTTYYVRAVGGCGSPTSCASITITVSSLSSSPASISATSNPVCSGNSTTLSVIGGFLGTGATWQWFTGSCSGAGAGTGSSIVVFPSSTTTYYVKAVGPCNTTSCASVIITVSSASTAPSSVSATVNPTCGGATTLSVVGGSLGTGASWNWYAGACGGGVIGTGTSIGVSPGSTTTYFVQAVGGCITTSCASVIITVNSPSTAPAGISATSNPVCAGSPTTLSVVGGSLGTGASWNWYSSSCGVGSIGSGPSIIVSPGSTTTYWVQASGTCNTTTCAQVTITINTSSTTPSSAAATPNPTCGGTTTLTFSGGSLGAGATWEWYSGSCGGTPAGTGSSISVSPASTTTYFVRAEGTCNTTGCANVIVTVNSSSTNPTGASATPNPVCAGSSVSLDVSGGSLGTGAAWNWFSGSCTGGFVATGASIIVSPSSTTTYFVKAVGTCNTTICVGVTVTVNPIPATPTPANNGPLCEGATLNLSTPFVSGGTYSWTGPNSFTSTDQNPIIPGVTTLNAGVYSVTVTVSGCTSGGGNTAVTINATPATPTPTNNGPLCEGDNLNLSTPFVSGGTYSWTGPNAFSSTVQNPGIAGVTSANAGVYSVTVTVSGCVSAANITTVTINTLPAIDTESSTDLTSCIVDDGTITITASGTAPPLQYSIDNGVTFAGSGSFTGLSAGSYPVVVSDDNGCTVTGSTLIITAAGAPPSPAAGTDATYCESDLFAGLTAAGSNIVWYSDPALNDSIGNGSPFPISPLVGTTTYYVTQTVSGCQSPSNAVVIIVNATPAAPAAGTDAIYCNGDSIIDLTAAGSNIEWFFDAGLTISIGVGSPLAISPAVDTTIYYVTQTTGSCQSLADSVVIIVYAIPAAPTTGNDTTYCDGDSIVSITAVGANIEWFSDPGLTLTIGSGSPFTPAPVVGINTFYATQTVNGCQSPADVVVIVVNAIPALPATGPDAAYCLGDPIAPLTATGSNIEWFSDTGLTNLIGAGSPFTPSPVIGTNTYYVTQTDSGCQSPPDSVTVIIDTLPVIDSISSTNVSTCIVNDGTIIITANGAPPLQYSIDGGSTFFADSSIFDSLSTGSYTIVVTDSNGCTATGGGTVIITAPGVPSMPAAGADTTYCQGDTVADLTAIGTNIAWFSDPGLTTLIDIGSPFSPTLIVGTNTFFVTQTISGCQSIANSVVIIVDTTPGAPTAGTDTTYCSGGPFADLTAAGPFNIGWFSDPGLTNPIGAGSPFTVSPGTGVTTYYVTQSLNNCQSPADSVAIIVNALPVIDSVSSTNTSACDSIDGTITITASGTPPLQYSIDGGSAFFADSTFNSLSTGSYIIFVTDSNGCTSTGGDTVTISAPGVPPAPVAGADTNYCQGDLVADLTAAGAGIEWFSDPGLTTLIGTGSPFSPTLTVGINTFYVTQTISGCQSAPSSVVIVVDTTLGAPTAGTDSTTYCSGGPFADLTASGLNIEWFSDPGLTTQIGAGSPFPVIPGTGTTIYYVTQSFGNCKSPADSVVIIVNALPVIDSVSSTDATACNLNDGTITITASGVPPLQYSIDGGINFSGFNIFDSLALGSFAILVTDATGCTKTGSVVISGPGTPPAPPAGTNATYCDGDPIADLIALGANIEWFSDPGLNSSIFTGSPFPPVNLVGTITYYVTQTISDCQSTDTSVVITINAIPAIPAAQKDTIYCEDDLNLVADLTAAGFNIEWFSGPGLPPPLIDTGSPFAPFPDVGTNIYYVTQTVNGCQSRPDSVIIIVEAIEKCVEEWYIFTGITPNNDENKTWTIFKGRFKDVPLNVVIYNRWGDLVWKSENYLNDWAGTNKNGQPLPDGTYFYIVDREGEVFTGWLNIAR